MRTALGRIGYKVVSYNHKKAIFVRLSEDQPTDFRTNDIKAPHEGQNTLDLRGLVELMVPEGYGACDLRALIYKVQVLKN